MSSEAPIVHHAIAELSVGIRAILDRAFRTWRAVKCRMLGRCHQLKVLDPIVSFIAIFMVNKFVAPQFATQQLLHDNAMLKAPTNVFVTIAHRGSLQTHL